MKRKICNEVRDACRLNDLLRSAVLRDMRLARTECRPPLCKLVESTTISANAQIAAGIFVLICLAFALLRWIRWLVTNAQTRLDTHRATADFVQGNVFVIGLGLVISNGAVLSVAGEPTENMIHATPFAVA